MLNALTAVSPVKNVKGRSFSWSISAMNEYERCPKAYGLSRFYCKIPYGQSAAGKYGDDVHKAAEMYIATSKQTITNPAHLAVVKKYADAMLDNPFFEISAEVALTFTKQFTPTSWFLNDAWLRIKIDVVRRKVEEHAAIYDWKTGKHISDNNDQLLLAIACFAHTHPAVEQFDAQYIWLKHGKVSDKVSVVKKDVPGIWAMFLPRVDKMQESWNRHEFPATPNREACLFCRASDADCRDRCCPPLKQA